MAIARREAFRKSFQAVLMNANQGPLVPALGRWGNAVNKAMHKSREDGINLPWGDLSQVPMDGRNLLHRMQLLVAGKEERRLKYHPHSLRHLSVTMAEGIGEGSALGQAIAGHRSATTTDIYRDMVSLQAAAVLKVSRRLTDIFMKVEQGLQLAKAPAGAAEMPPAAEQTVVQEAPEEVAPSPEPVAQPEPVETEAQKAIRESQESFRETLAKSGKPIQSRLSQVQGELSEVIRESYRPAALVLDSKNAADARDLAHVAGERFAVQPGKEIVPQDVGTGVTVVAPTPHPPAHEGRVPKALTLPKGVQKAKGREETIQAMVNAALDMVPPSQWFLDAGAWQRNGEWKPVVFMSKEQIEATLASGYMMGSQVVSRYGLTTSPKHDKLNIVMSMRTYLPYIYYATRATESPGEGDNEPVIQTFDNEMAGIEPIPKQLNPNAARKKKKTADPPADEPKKEKRKIKVFPERLIYLPILNLSNQALVDRFTEVLDHHYDDGKGGGLRVREPDQAKAMVRWLCILFSASRRVQKEMGDTVSWIGSHDILPKIGETTSQAFNRTRAKVFREPEPDMLVSFLLREGIRIYGLLGSNFRVDDEKGRRSMVETRLANVLNDASDYQQGDVASFLSVYKLPDWIDSEDPIGGDKGLKPEELARLKQWLRTVGAKITSAIAFTEQAADIEEFWSLVEPFYGSGARTIEIPGDLAAKAKRFNRMNQVDLLLGVRRCLRHMWELYNVNKSLFESRGVTKVDKINLIWGLYWSWILPSPAEAKERLRQAGTTLTKNSVKDIIEVMMMETSSKVILQRFQEAFDKFTELARKHINNTALDKRKAAAMIEAEAAKMAKDIADILFKGDVLTDSAAETVKRALEKYDKLLVVTGFEGAEAGNVSTFRKLAKGVAGSMAFSPGKVSYADLKDIYESGTSKLSAVVASSAILTLMAAKPLMDLRAVSSGATGDGSDEDGSVEDEVLASLTGKSGDLRTQPRLLEGEGGYTSAYYEGMMKETSDNLSKTSAGKVTQDIADLEDRINSEFAELFKKLTPSQRNDPRFLRLQEDINSGLRGYAAVSSSGASKDALKAKESYERRILIPIARSIRGLGYKMSLEAPPPELMPAKASETKRLPPQPADGKDSVDLFQDAIEPIEKEDPRWVDHTAEPGIIDKMVSEKFSSLPEHLRQKASRVLSQASAKLNSYGVPRTRPKKEARNALALGIYHRLVDIEMSSKLTPNRDTRMDMMSYDILATPQVMLVQQIRLRIPLLLAVIFSLLLRLDLVLELEVVDEHLAEFVVLALVEEALDLLVQGLFGRDASGVALVEERLEQELTDPLALGLSLVEDGGELVDPRLAMSVSLQGQVYMSLLVTHFRPPRPRMKCPRRLPRAGPCA